MSRFLALVLGLVLYAAAAAQSERLADPTRPPSAPAPARTDDAAPTAGPQLQSVLISPSRRVAVISGQTVVLGGKYGDATVSEITESAVHLRYANRRQTLQLVPGIVKRDRHAGADSNSEGPSR
jgi:MSHA biogenesis protein MshK